MINSVQATVAQLLIGSQKPEELVKAINLAIGINQNKY